MPTSKKHESARAKTKLKAPPSPRRRPAALRGALRFLPGAWFLVEIETGRLVEASAELCELLGLARGDAPELGIADLASAPTDDRWGLKRLSSELLDTPGRYEDVGLKAADGSEMAVDVHVEHPDGERRGVALCLVTDRSEQRRLHGELIAKHQELRRAFAELEQKTAELLAAQRLLEDRNRELGELSDQLRSTTHLATLGEITAEIAHQLNNPLAAAFGATRQIGKLSAKQPGGPDLKPMLDLLGNALERMRSTINDLRVAYRNSCLPEPEPRFLDLRAPISSVLSLFSTRLEDVSVREELPDGLPPVLFREMQLQHIVLNVIDNALDAMGGSGALEISAAKSDDGVLLRIGDSGPGVPEGLEAKIFDPFFTTREGGVGLGLAVVRRFAERNGANVRIGRSRLGGAEFAIQLRTAREEGARP
jgi:signal transduction histidine kinase